MSEMTQTSAPRSAYEIKRLSLKQLVLKRVTSNALIVAGSITIVLILLITTFGPMVFHRDPLDLNVQDRLQGPTVQYWFGTDNYGRDLLARVMHGARVSLFVGFAVSILSTIIGYVIGMYCAYFRWFDAVMMRILDGFMAFPAILLAIALMAALGAKTSNIVIALTIVFTPYVARVVRSSALVIKEQTFVEALRSQGASSNRIIWLNIAPNVVSPAIIQATFIFADSIITEAALSFLGAGVPPPNPSWGNILFDGKTLIFNNPWMTIFPGIAIVLTVLGMNLLGDGLRDLFDPTTGQTVKRRKKK
ncbi:ABC transporter permease [uncultured Brevibacterium sp.]|uniref:ABC transporter permease n=1 Tax=uncultured Brevibacterium sp. TaxID=189678 RepID=UPI0025DE000B|nr:ABC transporter permease [uncultured Brevibacterium sp.]